MQRVLFLMLLAAMIAGCRSTYSVDQAPPLVGPLQRSQLTDAFLHAHPDEPIGEPFLEMIRQARSGVHVVVFLGTWCSDSKREVPRFLRIVDGTGMTGADYELYGLDRKKESPDGREKKYAIERVPTFILERNGKELGRIVETPRTTLEGDILDILAKAGS